jgi:2-polyprenyl-3-methyl-5-hydroxy-6-metoxy-1,4-benzoquinol methylase
MRWKSKKEAQDAHIIGYKSDNVAKQYGSTIQPHYNRVRFIVENVKSGSYVLDVGCNAGALCIPLIEEKQCHVKGVDLVENLVARAKKNGVFAQVGSAEDLSMFNDGEFDCVTCTEVLEHLYDPSEAVAEAYRVLKDGGLYIATVPYYGGKMANDNFLGDWHQQNFTYEMLDTLFHAFFKRGNVGHVEIPYPDLYCRANGLKNTPQWVGLVAKKGNR